MSTERKDREPSEDTRSLWRAIYEAFELSLRWMAIVSNIDKDGVRFTKRYGPFESENDAGLYAQQVAYDGKTEIEIVEMHDVRIHNERVNRWHDEMDEKRKLRQYVGTATVPREDEVK